MTLICSISGWEISMLIFESSDGPIEISQQPHISKTDNQFFVGFRCILVSNVNSTTLNGLLWETSKEFLQFFLRLRLRFFKQMMTMCKFSIMLCDRCLNSSERFLCEKLHHHYFTIFTCIEILLDTVFLNIKSIKTKGFIALLLIHLREGLRPHQFFQSLSYKYRQTSHLM